MVPPVGLLVLRPGGERPSAVLAIQNIRAAISQIAQTTLRTAASQVVMPTTTPSQSLDSGATMSGKMADTMIGSRIRASKRSRKAASRSERGWADRCCISAVTFTVSIVPDRLSGPRQPARWLGQTPSLDQVAGQILLVMRRLTVPVACPIRGNEICSTGAHRQTGTFGPVDGDRLITLRLARPGYPDSPQHLLRLPRRR